MEWIGDLERAFAAAIYPNRVLVAAILAVALVGLALLARRRHWDRTVRRHPGRAAAVLAVALVVGLPAAWYLGSPLFLSSTVNEPAPIIGAVDPSATPLTAPTASPSRPNSPPQATPSPTPAPPTLRPERVGTFVGMDEFHFGRGTARLIETAPGAFTVRLEDFAVRNGPDLYIYLSPSADGYAKGAVELGRLKADTGNQNYVVPAGTDIDAGRSIVIWCRQFSVLFATAALG